MVDLVFIAGNDLFVCFYLYFSFSFLCLLFYKYLESNLAYIYYLLFDK